MTMRVKILFSLHLENSLSGKCKDRGKVDLFFKEAGHRKQEAGCMQEAGNKKQEQNHLTGILLLMFI